MTNEIIHPRNFIFLFFTSLILFWVQDLHAYPEPQIISAKVYCRHNTDGSCAPFFFARISGPSPDDIETAMVSGPSGSFPLMPAGVYRQFGLFYDKPSNVPSPTTLDNGNYTFMFTDKLGRTSSAVREFIYDDSISNPTNLNPENESYVGTTSFTLTFSPTISGNFLYQVTVWDYDYQAVWYESRIETTPSFTIPANQLQPNTAYRWKARVWDTLGQNCREAEATFFTGTKASPQINMSGVLSFPSLPPNESEIFYNFLYARAINVAPWDIDYFRATGPDNQIYNLDRRYYRFLEPAYNAN